MREQSPTPVAPGHLGQADGGSTAETAPGLPKAHEDASLPARALFFGNPDRTHVRISPDGSKLAFLANEKGILNVFTASPSDPTKATALTHVTKRNLRAFHWSTDGKTILYSLDNEGDENWRLHAVDLSTGKDREVVGIDGAQVVVANESPKRPHEVVIGINDRDKRYHDLYVLDVATGKRSMLMKNDGYERFVVDDDFRVRFGLKPTPDGGVDVQELTGGKWAPFTTIPMADHITTDFVDFDKNGTTLYMLDSRGRNTSAVVTVDLTTKKTNVVLDDGAADIESLLIHPTQKTLQAAEANYDRTRWHVIDKSVQLDFDYLKTLADGDIAVTSRSLDDKKWVVAFATEGPTRYYLYDRGKAERTSQFLFVSHDALSKLTLAKMEPVTFKARDGLELVAYLTMPLQATVPPLVLFVHGGPWTRDSYGYNPVVQWLASRGYAVLQGELPGVDGIRKGLPQRRQPRVGPQDAGRPHRRCEVGDRQGDRPASRGHLWRKLRRLRRARGSDVHPRPLLLRRRHRRPVQPPETLLASIPPYWASEYEDMIRRMGDPRTEDGKKLLHDRSPLFHVDAIKKPLLIGQGKNDPRVKQAESDQIVAAMQKNGTPVTYVLYPDEGHGFNRVENKRSFNAVAEVFLAQCLGGPYQRIGSDFTGSSITVPVGKERIPSLANALPR